MGHFVMEQSLLRQLMEGAKAGDEASFERIVILHEQLVLRVAQRLLLNREDAKDAAQEVFVRLHRNLRRFDERKELGPWLYRVTVNICRDIRRRTKRNVPLEPGHDSMDLSPDPEVSAAAAQQYRMVLEALGQLSPREREVIVLRDLEGRSTGEVAGILGSSEATVRSQLSTGRVKIRSYIADRMRKRT
jgi:RNA polymerase sigma-70 factor (ECF subfamily)